MNKINRSFCLSFLLGAPGDSVSRAPCQPLWVEEIEIKPGLSSCRQHDPLYSDRPFKCTELFTQQHDPLYSDRPFKCTELFTQQHDPLYSDRPFKCTELFTQQHDPLYSDRPFKCTELFTQQHDPLYSDRPFKCTELFTQQHDPLYSDRPFKCTELFTQQHDPLYSDRPFKCTELFTQQHDPLYRLQSDPLQQRKYESCRRCAGPDCVTKYLGVLLTDKKADIDEKQRLLFQDTAQRADQFARNNGHHEICRRALAPLSGAGISHLQTCLTTINTAVILAEDSSYRTRAHLFYKKIRADSAVTFRNDVREQVDMDLAEWCLNPRSSCHIEERVFPMTARSAEDYSVVRSSGSSSVGSFTDNLLSRSSGTRYLPLLDPLGYTGNIEAGTSTLAHIILYTARYLPLLDPLGYTGTSTLAHIILYTARYLPLLDPLMNTGTSTLAHIILYTARYLPLLDPLMNTGTSTLAHIILYTARYLPLLDPLGYTGNIEAGTSTPLNY
ncbi:hypothetical protein RRG08_023330 [Elysia crispata]|uniref:Uncharacterized protein n=2 Tax=Elysia crispata TaxID=231223 RepID=A0AAE1BCJ1_9GAST|nr:hypothetical protein RRG08_023330 [Elysia crispata]